MECVLAYGQVMSEMFINSFIIFMPSYATCFVALSNACMRIRA